MLTRGRALLFVATAAALGLTGRALVGRPVAPWVAGLALALYLGVLLCGVLSPRLQMFAAVLWRGPPGARGVALTFDDGPHPTHTARVLDELDRWGARATFFVLGEKAERCPGLVAQIAARGPRSACMATGTTGFWRFAQRRPSARTSRARWRSSGP